ncbi:putative mitochondrial protein [Andalucia godoyi]|uniref:Putative mitochondrial protein n=1 Tax=Andalucia godoyi TaxID=505711 RepID=A0A8K0AIJ4_ANDGO|nr:putative mitochondrial protein [Andalucia godoyi]|eukprot:ANDGO_02048.mRNA.1 putative mitochondrial protein
MSRSSRSQKIGASLHARGPKKPSVSSADDPLASPTLSPPTSTPSSSSSLPPVSRVVLDHCPICSGEFKLDELPSVPCVKRAFPWSPVCDLESGALLLSASMDQFSDHDKFHAISVMSADSAARIEALQSLFPNHPQLVASSSSRNVFEFCADTTGLYHQFVFRLPSFFGDLSKARMRTCEVALLSLYASHIFVYSTRHCVQGSDIHYLQTLLACMEECVRASSLPASRPFFTVRSGPGYIGDWIMKSGMPAVTGMLHASQRAAQHPPYFASPSKPDFGFNASSAPLLPDSIVNTLSIVLHIHECTMSPPRDWDALERSIADSLMSVLCPGFLNIEVHLVAAPVDSLSDAVASIKRRLDLPVVPKFHCSEREWIRQCVRIWETNQQNGKFLRDSLDQERFI